MGGKDEKSGVLERAEKRLEKVMRTEDERERHWELYRIVEGLTESDFFDRALEIVELLPPGYMRIQALCYVAGGLGRRGDDPERALDIIGEAMRMSENLTDPIRIVDALQDIGRSFAVGGFPKKALEIAKTLPEGKELERSQVLKAVVWAYLVENDVDKSMETAKTIPDAGIKETALGSIVRKLAKDGDYYGALEVTSLIEEESGRRSSYHNIAESLGRSGLEKRILAARKKAANRIENGRNEEALRIVDDAIEHIKSGLSVANLCQANGLVGRWNSLRKELEDLAEMAKAESGLDEPLPDLDMPRVDRYLMRTPEQSIEGLESMIKKYKSELDGHPFEIKKNRIESIGETAQYIALNYTILGSRTEADYWFGEAVRHLVAADEMLKELGSRLRYVQALKLLDSVIPLRDRQLYERTSRIIEGLVPEPVPGTDRVPSEIFEAYLDSMASLIRKDYDLTMERLMRLREWENKKELLYYRGLADSIEGIVANDKAMFLEGIHTILPTFKRRLAQLPDIPICREASSLFIIARDSGMDLTLDDVDDKYREFIPRVLVETEVPSRVDETEVAED